MHLTLRFVGEVTEETGDDLHAELERVAAPAFDLRLRGLGQFASKGRTRAIWADIEKNPALEHLQATVEGACRRLGLAAAGRRSIGSASGRERVVQHVLISVVAG